LSEEGLCCDCRAQNWAFSSMMGLTPYRLGAGHWTAVYKKEPRPRLARVLAERFFWTTSQSSILVPVPAHSLHKRQRGWDPVLKLAKVLSKKTGWPLVCALRRRPTVSQKSLYRAERFINADKSYLLTRKSVEQKICWLVDDVVTTGATVQACAALLKKAGATEVRILCLALH
jgi:ComF family protein